MVLKRIYLIRTLLSRDCLQMQEAYALPICFHPKPVAMNHRNNLASDTPLNLQLRNSFRIIFQPGFFDGSSDWMVMTKFNQCRCSEDFDQLQHGCLQHRREWTASHLPTHPFLIDEVEEHFVLWQLGKIQEMHQLVRDHGMETNFTLVGHGESQFRPCVCLLYIAPVDLPRKVWLVCR